MTATTGRAGTCAWSSSSATAAVSDAVSGSITIHPVAPAMNVMFERSTPRTWYTPSATSKRPWIALSCAWRHRLGCTESGASPVMNAQSAGSHTACPYVAWTTGPGRRDPPGVAAVKSSGSSGTSAATAALAAAVVALGGLRSASVMRPPGWTARRYAVG